MKVVKKSLSQQKEELSKKEAQLNALIDNSDLVSRLGYLDTITEYAGAKIDKAKTIITPKGKLIEKKQVEIKEAKARKAKVNGVKNYIKIYSYKNKSGIRPHEHIAMIRRYGMEETGLGSEAMDVPVRLICEVIQEDFKPFQRWLTINY